MKFEDETIAKRFHMLAWYPSPIKIVTKPGSDVAIAALKLLAPEKIKSTHHIHKEGTPNPICTRRAVNEVTHPDIQNTEVTPFYPITPGGPYLFMNGKVITQHLKEKIRNEIPRQELIQYSKKKNNWTDTTFRKEKNGRAISNQSRDYQRQSTK